MALWDEVVTRYPATTLVELTNAGASTSASSVDTSRANAAVDDVVGAFLTYAGETYDNTDAQHVEIGVEGVVARLRMFGEFSNETIRAEYDRFIQRLRDLRNYSHRARVQPKSNSKLDPSSLDSTQTQRPEFDRVQFDHVYPKAPHPQTWESD